MNCKNCYQEISDGSKFCPHCGAKQNEVQPNAEQENAVKNDPVQATGAVKTTENAAGYQDVSGYQNNGGYQDAAGYQNNGGYQDAAGYQNNGGYQDAAGYQNNGGYQDAA
ncbi:MAG: zinc-ribbon domain-containing protein, partial [[Ruminococcus] lactaris]